MSIIKGQIKVHDQGTTATDTILHPETEASLVSGLSTVATSGSYNDLSNKPTIPAAANNATITIKMNGANVDSFTVNASAAKTIDLGNVITDVSGYVPTSRAINGKALSSNITLNGTDIIIDAETGSPTISSAFTSLSNNKQDKITATNKLAASLISGLATVATSGSYNDLSNKPTIPTVNDATITIKMNNASKGTFTTNAGTAKTIDLGTVITSHQDISGKENTSNKVGTWSATTTNTNYPTEKLVKDSLDTKENKSPKLVLSLSQIVFQDPLVFLITQEQYNDATNGDYSNIDIDASAIGLGTIIAPKSIANGFVSGSAIIPFGQSEGPINNEVYSYFITPERYMYVWNQSLDLDGDIATTSYVDNAIPDDLVIYSGSTTPLHLAQFGADSSIITDSGLSADDIQSKITSTNKLSASLVSGLATVATSGSYNDLSDKPTIPSGITGAGVYYGVCSTAGATAAKTVTLSRGDGFALATGVTVFIKFTAANTASNPTLNVNGTGAKALMQYGTTAMSTNQQSTGWRANSIVALTYDGTNWIRTHWENSVLYYTSIYCTTSASTAAKVGAISSGGYQLTAGKNFQVMMYYSNTKAAALTLNIASTGAKPIYINGKPSSATNYTLPAGEYLVYYDGTNYYFETDGTIRAKNIVADNLSTITDSTPYLLRQSGGDLDVGNREAIKKLVGGTMVWNQLVPAGGGSTIVPANHVYYYYNGTTETIGKGNTEVNIPGASGAVIIDLTRMFGTEIANYVYTTGGVNFIKPFIKNASKSYNAGDLISVKTSAHVTKDANAVTLGTYPVDNIDLRGKLKLDANSKLYYDGDEYASDGTVTRKYAIVDMGTLSWMYRSAQQVFTLSVRGFSKTNGNVVCALYPQHVGAFADMPNKSIATFASFNANDIIVKDSSYTSAASFKTAMSGVYLVYELVTPTTESASPLTNPQIIDPNGTEEFVDTRTVPMPVGHETVYLSNTIGNAVGELLQPIKSSSAGFRMLTLAGNSDTLTGQDFADYYTNPSPAHMIYHSGQRQYYYLQTISTGTNYNVYYICPSSSGSAATRDTIEITPTGYWSLWA